MRFSSKVVVSAVALVLQSVPVFAADSAKTEPAAVPPAAASEAAKPAEPAPAVKPAAAAALKIGSVVDVNTIPAFRNTLKAGTSIRYMGDEFGLKAYFLSNGTSGSIAYVSPDAQAYMIGSLFGADGSPITALQAARLKAAGFDPTSYLGFEEPTPPPALDPSAPAPASTSAAASTAAPSAPPAPATPPATTKAQASAPAAPAAQQQKKSAGQVLLSEANQASWIAYGSPLAPQLTVFMDPGCSDCHDFFKMIYPYAEQKKIYLRVIPVTAIDPNNSPDKVGKVFSVPVPADAWKDIMNGKDAPAGVEVSAGAHEATLANEALFERWKLPGTPYNLYTSKATGQVKVLFGTPDSLKDFMTDIGVAP